MKNLIYFATLICAVVLLFSCKPCPECPEVATADVKQDNPYTATLRDTISYATYDLWKNNWKTYGQAFTANLLTEYFTMPLLDLNEFLSFPGTGRNTVVASRFVLGLEINGPDTTQHLMLVGVGSDGASLTNAALQQYIYDVTAPCPTSCGVTSLQKMKK